MIRFNQLKSGTSLKGLIAGGFLAGALGLAVSQTGTPYGSGSSPGSAQDQTMSSPGAPDQTGGRINPSDPSVSGSASAASNPANAATMNTGWRIRVCSEKTKAQSINFTLSPAEKGGKAKSEAGASSSDMYPGTTAMPGSTSPDLSATKASPSGSTANMPMEPATATWTRGESTLIPVPGSLGDADKIRIEAIPGEKNQKASVCLLYNDHVAKKLNFDDREVSTVKKTQTGECGC